MSSDHVGPWLVGGYIGDEIQPSYIGIIISQYKDPYQPTSQKPTPTFSTAGSPEIESNRIKKREGVFLPK